MKTALLVGLAVFALGAGQSWSQMPDTTAPAVVSAVSLDGRHVSVCFSEAMDPLGLDNSDYYWVQEGAGFVGVAAITLMPGNAMVVLHLQTAVTGPFRVEAHFLFDV